MTKLTKALLVAPAAMAVAVPVAQGGARRPNPWKNGSVMKPNPWKDTGVTKPHPWKCTDVARHVTRMNPWKSGRNFL